MTDSRTVTTRLRPSSPRHHLPHDTRHARIRPHVRCGQPRPCPRRSVRPPPGRIPPPLTVTPPSPTPTPTTTTTDDAATHRHADTDPATDATVPVDGDSDDAALQNVLHRVRNLETRVDEQNVRIDELEATNETLRETVAQQPDRIDTLEEELESVRTSIIGVFGTLTPMKKSDYAGVMTSACSGHSTKTPDVLSSFVHSISMYPASIWRSQSGHSSRLGRSLFIGTNYEAVISVEHSSFRIYCRLVNYHFFAGSSRSR